MRIACPKCDFRPSPRTLWICRPGCRKKWNTFATHGICPHCSKFWHDTMCPRCRNWSPHDDWYRDDSASRLIGLKELQGEAKNQELDHGQWTVDHVSMVRGLWSIVRFELE